MTENQFLQLYVFIPYYEHNLVKVVVERPFENRLDFDFLIHGITTNQVRIKVAYHGVLFDEPNDHPPYA